MSQYPAFRVYFFLFAFFRFSSTYKLILPSDNIPINLGESSGSLTYASQLGLAESVNENRPQGFGETVLDNLQVQYIQDKEDDQENQGEQLSQTDEDDTILVREEAEMQAILLNQPPPILKEEDKNPLPTEKASVPEKAWDKNPQVLNSAPIYVTDNGYFNQQDINALVWISMLFLFMVFKILHYTCALTGPTSCTLKEFQPAYQAFFREIMFFFLVLCVIYLLTWFTIDFHSDLHEVAFAFTHFILVWFISGFLILLIADWKARTWINYEKAIKFTQEDGWALKERFQQLYMHKRHFKMLPMMNYLALRQDYLCPSHLLALRESFKRSDFNFAKYLTLCLAQTVQRFFYLRLVSVLICIAFTIGWHFMYIYTTFKIGMIVAIVTPLLILILTAFSISHLNKIFKMLIPHVEKPLDFNIKLGLDNINPFDHYLDVERPAFLGGQNDDERRSQSVLGSALPFIEDQEDEQIERPQPRGVNVNPKGAKGPRVCCCRKSNRHESLFCCGKVGISCLFNFQQTIYLSACLWATSFIFREIEVIHDFYGWISYIILGAVLIIMLIFFLYQVPVWLKMFTLCTSIQMMKKRNLEEQVISEQKFQIAQSSLRIYQTFKIIRRQYMHDMGQKNNSQIKLERLTERLLYEVFVQFQKNRKNENEERVISSRRCEEFVKACGAQLSERQKYVLLKNAESKEFITFQDMKNAVRANMNDVMIDPQEVVKKVLIVYFSTKEGKLITDYTITLENLYTFFKDFQTYFEQEDVNSFMTEIQIFMRETNGGELTIQIEEIAFLVRDNIERLPK